MTIKLDVKRQAILDAKGHILVQGGPGSGKTTIALLKVKTVFPDLLLGQKLLFLSFSRAAVRQVLSKCRTVLTYEERRVIEVKTYHSFCLEFLKAHGRLLTGKPVTFLYPTEERLRKSKFSGDWKTEQQRLAREEACFCFDMLAFGTAELLERSEALRTLYSQCYPMIIVDEFQDTDDRQWRIIKSLSSLTRIFCLADPEQSIFQYRSEVNPLRIDIFQESAHPEIFDFGDDNHRSPNSSILAFADAILKNQSRLPESDDVHVLNYPRFSFKEYVHASVSWTIDQLLSKGIEQPTIAVLARSNTLVASISNILAEARYYRGYLLEPIEHGVVWDEELSLAAAIIVASIMEWSSQDKKNAIALTLGLISYYYDLKNANHPSNSALEDTTKYLKAAEAVREDRPSRLMVVKDLFNVYDKSMSFVGNPIVDWRTARQALYEIKPLQEVFRNARMVRLFRATDKLGEGLSSIWREHGSYVNASAFVRRILQSERLASDEQTDEQCLLMSIHKSKGKEFDGVVLVEGQRNSLFFAYDAHPYTQSRRLLRVGITRAKSIVTILRSTEAMPLVDVMDVFD